MEINKILHLEYEKFIIHSLNCFKVLYLFLQISWKINSREKKKLHLGKIDLRCFWISFQTLSECSIYFLRLENVLKVLDFLFKLRSVFINWEKTCYEWELVVWKISRKCEIRIFVWRQVSFFSKQSIKILKILKTSVKFLYEVCTKRCNPSFKKKLKYASFAIYIKRVICLKVMKIICI